MTVIEKARADLAGLDAGGTAIVVLRSDSEADIRSVVEGYVHQYYRPSTTARGDVLVEGPSDGGMAELTGFGTIKEFRQPFTGTDSQKYSVGTGGNSLLDFLEEHLSGPRAAMPQLLYIPSVRYLVGNPAQGRTEEELQQLYLLRRAALEKRRGNCGLLVVIGCPNGEICQELESDTYILDIEYPQDDEIRGIIESAYQDCSLYPEVPIPDFLMSELTGLFRGFRGDAVRSTILLAYAKMEDPFSGSARQLKAEIKELKLQMLKKAAGLEWLDPSDTDVGGLAVLREWMEKKEILFRYNAAARLHKVRMPQGILVSGIPGTGKTLMARWIARQLRLPLFQLDMGSIMGRYLGESESRFQNALRLVEAMAPCVLFIDELEKSFSGVGGQSESNDSLRRIFARFLSWLQEGERRETPVFVFATANRLNLPPEFLRKGRFDEKFYTFLPTGRECGEIALLHLQKHSAMLDPDCTPQALQARVVEPFLREAAVLKKFLTGADIASIASEAFQELFSAKFSRLPDKERQEAAVEVSPALKVSLEELTEAFCQKLSEAQVYGDTNLPDVAEYWLEVRQRQLRSVSREAPLLAFDSYDPATGMFTNLQLPTEKPDEYRDALMKRLERKPSGSPAGAYDGRLRDTVALELFRHKTERGGYYG